MMHRILTLILMAVAAVAAWGLTPEEVSRYTSQAAEGKEWAQLQLMQHYQKMREFSKANEYARMLYGNGEARGAYRGRACQYLGVNTVNGNDMAKSRDEAMSWWRRGAELGDDHSARLLAEIHDNKGIPELLDRAEAWRWYVRAADLKNGYCCRLVARQYEEAPEAGKPLPDSIYPGAVRDLAASTKYWDLYLESKPLYEHPQGGMYRKSSPEINYKLGNRYFSGEGGVEQDYEKAVNCYRGAVETSDEPENIDRGSRALTDEEAGEAMWRIGTCYRFGRGVAQNEINARKWTRRAAARGHEKAKKYLEMEQ